jgi:hypothetical protein
LRVGSREVDVGVEINKERGYRILPTYGFLDFVEEDMSLAFPCTASGDERIESLSISNFGMFHRFQIDADDSCGLDSP